MPRPSAPVAPTLMPPARLPRQQLLAMAGFGFAFQLLVGSPWCFAGVAWLSLLPLLVLIRATPISQALAFAVGIPFVARFLGALWSGLGAADAAAAAVTIAGLTAVVLLCHRLVMRELPLVGSFAAPCAVVVVEVIAQHWTLPGANLLPLSATQAGDVPLSRFIDILTPLGISFCVVWGQSVMAGFGEAWLAEDPHPQATRERGLRLGANLCFILVAVVFHFGGFFRDDPVRAGTHESAVLGVCAAGLLVMLVMAQSAKMRRLSPREAVPA